MKLAKLHEQEGEIPLPCWPQAFHQLLIIAGKRSRYW